MSRISPKLIDVERCRVETDDKLSLGMYSSSNNMGIKQIVKNCEDGRKTKPTKTIVFYIKPSGRFPTQLFCNIKNDRFKYVKHIT